MPKVYCTKEFEFEAAHHLINYDGPCANVHGHSYKLQVTVSGNVDIHHQDIASDCMVIDFKNLKSIVELAVIDSHDHADLNTIYANPTAEIMVIEMFYTISGLLPRDVKLESVKLWETSTSFAEYRGECHE